MNKRAVLKKKAKQQLKGKLLLAAVTLLLGQILSNMDLLSPEIYNFEYTETSMIFTTLRILSFLLNGVICLGVSRFSLNIINNREEARFSTLFSGFSVYLKVLGLHILSMLAIMLGTTLLIVPGIIISLMFSQAYYILAEDDDKSIIQCLRESYQMMKGHKWELFIFQLSFLGWIILVVVTLGLAAIWVEPYIQVTFANYYLELKGSSENILDSDDSKINIS